MIFSVAFWAEVAAQVCLKPFTVFQTACMAVDSKAVFQQRILELGLFGAREKFEECGWRTHGLFAFAIPQGQGGLVSEDVFKERVLKRILGFEGDEEPPEAAAVRRLYFESHTLTVGELRQRMERTDSDAPRRVPQAEREARKGVVRDRLAPGLLVEGDLEPANCTIDRFVQQVDDNLVEWVPWEEAPKRDQELASAPGKRKWMADASGIVREKNIRAEIQADVSSALRVSWALQRRGIAAEVAGLMSFEAHEKLRLRLMGALTNDPSDPRFAAPSMEQIKNADKEAWRQMAKKCRTGVRPQSSLDPLPMDIAIGEVLASMEFALALMPMPALSARSSNTRTAHARAGDSDEEAERQKSGHRRANKAEKRSAAKPNPQPQKFQDQQRRPKGKGKGNPLPRQLVGGVSCTAAGQAICFGFNLGECKAAKAGERCPRGLHVCTKVGCEGKHPANECIM
jgi:hypothetical protein